MSFGAFWNLISKLSIQKSNSKICLVFFELRNNACKNVLCNSSSIHAICFASFVHSKAAFSTFQNWARVLLYWYLCTFIGFYFFIHFSEVFESYSSIKILSVSIFSHLASVKKKLFIFNCLRRLLEHLSDLMNNRTYLYLSFPAFWMK